MKKRLLQLIIIAASLIPVVAQAACDCGSVDPNEPCKGNYVEYTRTGGDFGGRYVDFTINDTLVRFEFDCDGGECVCGQFANGRDYWVAPTENGRDVTITRIIPDAHGSGEAYRNGAMFGPTTRGHNQGYDGRDNGMTFGDFDPGLSIELPVSVNPSAEERPVTILKSVSTKTEENCTYAGRVCLDQVEVLTVLDEALGDVFRPSYYGTVKTMYQADLFDPSILSNLEPLEDSVSWDGALETIMGVRPAVHMDYQVQRQSFSAVLNFFPPGATARGYAGYVGQHMQKVFLKLTEKAEGEDIQKKEQLAKYIAQYGIDLWSVFTDPDPGDPCGHWEANGGFNNNYFAPILFAGELLGQDWADQIDEVMSTQNGKNCFAETGFIQPSTVTAIGKGIPLFGSVEGNLGIETVTCSSNANNINNNFLTDGWGRGKVDGVCQDLGSGCPTPYMGCCTHGHWLASAMAIWLTPAVYDHFPENARHWLEYVDRSRSAGESVGKEFGAYCDASSYNITGFNTGYDTQVAYNAWEAYRACSKTKTCPGMTLTVAESDKKVNSADVDQNGKTESKDALLVLRISLGLGENSQNLQYAHGDVDCSNNVDSGDALLILRYSLGLDMNKTAWCL